MTSRGRLGLGTAAALLVLSSCSNGLSEAEESWCYQNVIDVGHTGYVMDLAIRTTDETMGVISLPEGGFDGSTGKRVWYAFLTKDDYVLTCKAAFDQQ